MLKGGDSPSTKAPGLPNITGTISVRYAEDGMAVLENLSGVFSSGISTTGAMHAQGGYVTKNGIISANFSATSSNAIYGAASTVQPPALALLPQIRY